MYVVLVLGMTTHLIVGSVSGSYILVELGSLQCRCHDCVSVKLIVQLALSGALPCYMYHATCTMVTLPFDVTIKIVFTTFSVFIFVSVLLLVFVSVRFR